MSICQENRVIYHYCSVSGFMNILQNQCLWLTEASFTNDAWENRMLDPIFEEALEQLTEEGEIACGQIDLAMVIQNRCFFCTKPATPPKPTLKAAKITRKMP